jgi:hypothetical protein
MMILVLAACGGGGPVATGGSPSPAPITGPTGGQGTLLPTPGNVATSPPSAPWPAGWDAAMCATFAQLVETQELAVDIGRALDEDDRADARALTAELSASVAATRGLLADMREWATADVIRADIGSLLDLGEEMATRYDRYLNANRRQALGRAREAGAQMPEVVDQLTERLGLLADQGLRCPGIAFELETPPEQ